ncbi:hypothetical protein SLA2020_287000 [Shorea laevis]
MIPISLLFLSKFLPSSVHPIPFTPKRITGQLPLRAPSSFGYTKSPNFYLLMRRFSSCHQGVLSLDPLRHDNLLIFSSSLQDETQSSQSTSVVDINLSGSNDLARQLASEVPLRSTSNSESRIQDNLLDDFEGSSNPKDSVENQSLTEDPNSSIPMDSQSLLTDKTNSCNRVEPSANRTASAVLYASSKDGEKLSLNEVSEDPASSKE